MKLKDIYDQLAYSELRHIVLGSGTLDDDMGMTADSFTKLFPLVQLGLTDLHKKFLLREKEFFVELQLDQTNYDLTMNYAQSNRGARATVKYIDDLLDPFLDDFMRVEKIYGVRNGSRYTIPYNVRDDDTAIRSPRHGKLILPDDPEKAIWLKETVKLRVIYRADHPKIESYQAAQPMQTEIYLPSTFLQALLYYIASRALSAQGGTAEFHEGNNYSMKYAGAVAELEGENYEATVDIEHDKLAGRGFP